MVDLVDGFTDSLIYGELRLNGRLWLTSTPSYLGGRDQEDLGSKPARANSA
jgi:hypothetical protein